MSDFSNMCNEMDEHSKSSFARVLAQRHTRECAPTLDQLEDVIQKVQLKAQESRDSK